MNPIDMDAVIAELQKPNGWRRGGTGPWQEPDGSVCLLGAFARVMQPEDAYLLAPHLPVVPIIREHFADRVSSRSGWDTVPDFNDHPDTTLDDVILVCEKARAEQ